MSLEQSAGRILLVRVQGLARSDEPNAVTGQRRQLLIQMENASTVTVDFVHADAIELSLGCIGHELVQGRTTRSGARKSGIYVLTGALPATSVDVVPKFPQLHFTVLVVRGDTGVQSTVHEQFSYTVFGHLSPFWDLGKIGT